MDKPAGGSVTEAHITIIPINKMTDRRTLFDFLLFPSLLDIVTPVNFPFTIGRSLRFVHRLLIAHEPRLGLLIGHAGEVGFQGAENDALGGGEPGV